jgi:hypothetical protein
MRLHLDDQRSQYVAFDKDSLIDLRKLAVRKKDVDHRTSDGDNHASRLAQGDILFRLACA